MLRYKALLICNTIKAWLVVQLAGNIINNETHSAKLGFRFKVSQNRASVMPSNKVGLVG